MDTQYPRNQDKKQGIQHGGGFQGRNILSPTFETHPPRHLITWLVIGHPMVCKMISGPC